MSTRVVTCLSVDAHRVAFAAALAVALVITLGNSPGVSAQGTSGAASSAPPAAGSAPSAASESRACRKAKSRVAGEQRTIAKVQRSIDHTRADSTTCSTKPVCDRYATKITELEARRAHHASRLAKLRTAAGSACGSS